MDVLNAGARARRTDSLPHALVRRARETPERKLVTEVGGRELGYAAFVEEVLAWAGGFRALGVRAGDRVAVMFPTSIVALEAWLGLAWLRAWHVGVNTDLKGRWLAHAINHPACSALVVAERYLDRIAAVGADLQRLELVIVPDARTAPSGLPWRVVAGEDSPGRGRRVADLDPPERHDVSSLVYTSGTTGPPKAVIVPFGLYQSGLPVLADLDESDCLYSPWPTFHVSAQTPFAMTVALGARTVVRERFDVAAFWDDVNAHGCTYAALVPAIAAWLLAREPSPDDARNPLRNVMIAPVIPRVAELADRFGFAVRTSFGMTEIGGVLASPERDLRTHTLGCGKPLPGYELRLVDQHDYQVTRGQVGELVVRSDEPWALTSGYYRDPEKTAEAWRNGWFHTGDVFRIDDDGYWHFVDRKKDALRRRGENVSSFQVEAVANNHPAVAESAAIGVPADEPGEEEIKLCTVLRPAATLSHEALHAFLVDQLPRFMVPRYIEFLMVLPKTEATMRVQKTALRENWRTPDTWDRKRAGLQVPR